MEVPFWIMLFTTLLSTKISAETNSTNIDTKIATNVLEHRAKATIERIDLNKQVNNSFEIHRITQPVMETLSSSDQVNKKILLNSRNSSEKSDKLSDFKPSPQLETYFEYNRFPVVPALPEAKHFTQFNTNEKPIRSEVFSWTESPKLLTTHNQILYNKINFPTTQVPFLTSKNHPYPYFINNNYPEITTKSSYLNEPPSRDSYNTTTDIQYPYVITGTNHDTTSKNTNNGNLPNYSKQNGFLPGNFGNPSAISNNYGNLHSGISEKFGANIFDKPSVWNKGEYSGIGGLPLQKPNFEHTISPSTELHQSPWKKIIKFLTAIIPIGLLLSALSPTIINVSPTNATYVIKKKINIIRQLILIFIF